MPRPDPRTLLDVWESGLSQQPQHKILTILEAFLEGCSRSDIAAMPVGRRDSALLDLREQMFGPVLATVVKCPDCGERLEADVAVADIRAPAANDLGKVRTFSADGHRIAFRLPKVDDLIAIPADSAVAEARALLLRRCVIEAYDEAGRAIEPHELPEPVVRGLSARMASLDPQADISLSLKCPACSVVFAALLDVASFLLSDLHMWAQRMLREVHALASAYGWGEEEILALSPARRRIYVEMAAP
jgi:hypothetical protein